MKEKTKKEMGVELFEYIKEQFDIPDRVESMLIDIKYDEPLKITCTFFPAEKEA